MKYNHAFTFGFSLENESPNGETTPQEIRQALINALAQCTDEDLIGNCGAPFDTYEVDA
jgi:hypothetical protein